MKKILCSMLALVLAVGVVLPFIVAGAENGTSPRTIADELTGWEISNATSIHSFVTRINDDWNSITNPIGTIWLELSEYGTVAEREFTWEGTLFHSGDIIFANGPVTMTATRHIHSFDLSTPGLDFNGYGFPLFRYSRHNHEILDFLTARNITTDEWAYVNVYDVWIDNVDGEWVEVTELVGESFRAPVVPLASGAPDFVDSNFVIPAGSTFELDEGIYVLSRWSGAGPLIIVVGGDASLLTDAPADQAELPAAVAVSEDIAPVYIVPAAQATATPQPVTEAAPTATAPPITLSPVHTEMATSQPNIPAMPVFDNFPVPAPPQDAAFTAPPSSASVMLNGTTVSGNVQITFVGGNIRVSLDCVAEILGRPVPSNFGSGAFVSLNAVNNLFGYVAGWLPSMEILTLHTAG